MTLDPHHPHWGGIIALKNRIHFTDTNLERIDQWYTDSRLNEILSQDQEEFEIPEPSLLAQFSNQTLENALPPKPKETASLPWLSQTQQLTVPTSPPGKLALLTKGNQRFALEPTNDGHFILDAPTGKIGAYICIAIEGKLYYGEIIAVTTTAAWLNQLVGKQLAKIRENHVTGQLSLIVLDSSNLYIPTPS